MGNKINTLQAQMSSKIELPVVWGERESVVLRNAVDSFLQTLSPHTNRAYNAAFEMFYSQRLLNPEQTLEQFAKQNLENLLDKIRSDSRGNTESTKQARAAAFISFTSFLQRKTGGIIKKAIPNRGNSSPTFQTDREKSDTKALTTEEWYSFLHALKKLNVRDYLVAKIALQGAKRISEVINAQIEDIEWDKNRITFGQLKAKERKKVTVITYPKNFMNELKAYLNGRTSGHIFISREGNPLKQAHLWRSFVGAGKAAGIPFQVHPHVLRATAITHFVERGFSADQISKVSGHSSLKQVMYYDRSAIEKNLTTTVCLI
mgnify:CR=1 FL=1